MNYAQADELREKIHIDQSARYSVSINGDFQFDSLDDSNQANPSGNMTKTESKVESTVQNAAMAQVDCSEEKQELHQAPFALRDIDLNVPKGWSNHFGLS